MNLKKRVQEMCKMLKGFDHQPGPYLMIEIRNWEEVVLHGDPNAVPNLEHDLVNTFNVLPVFLPKDGDNLFGVEVMTPENLDVAAIVKRFQEAGFVTGATEMIGVEQ